MTIRSNQAGIMVDLVAWAKTLVGTGSAASPKIDDAKFYIRKFPWDTSILFPAAIFSPVNPTLAPATNRQSDYGHGVLVTLAKQTNRSLIVDEDDPWYWREILEQAIQDNRIPARPAVWCKIEPTTYLDAAAFASDLDATGFIIRAMRRYTNNT